MAALRSRRPAGEAVSDWPSRGDATWPFPRRSPRCPEHAPWGWSILGTSHSKGGAVMPWPREGWGTGRSTPYWRPEPAPLEETRGPNRRGGRRSGSFHARRGQLPRRGGRRSLFAAMQLSRPAPRLRSGWPRSREVAPLLGEGPDRLPGREGPRRCGPEDGRARREGDLRGGEGFRRAPVPPWEPPLDVGVYRGAPT